MKIFVINLKKATARRDSAALQLEKHGLEYEFFDAWTGDQALEEKLFNWNEDAFRVRTGCPSPKGAIGCFASHLMLWKKCVELQQPILILEDDFLLKEHITDALATTDALIEQYGFIRLNGDSKHIIPVATHGAYELRRYKKAPLLALAYALSPAAAQTLVDNFDEYVEPVDYYLKRFWVSKQKVYHLSPEPITLSDHWLISAIPHNSGDGKTFSLRLQRLWDQIANGFMRDMHNLAFAIHNLLRPNNRI
jgi:glycosyl transferase family 25